MKQYFGLITIVFHMLSLLIWSATKGNVKAQVAFDVVCPNVKVVQDFDMLKYSGVWFEIESYPSSKDEFDVCISLNYSVQTDGVLQVESSWFNTSSRTHESIRGSAQFVNPGLEAKLLITYPTSFVTESMLTNGNFWIIETDYKNYAIVFLCLPIGPNISFQFLSYLSRERFPFAMGLNFVHQRIEALGLDRAFLKPNDQINCPSKARK